ncbi:MAG: YjbE family putative metal transport protein [Steroidobacteraceae bacterium]|jgi:YjbE family integral membrane protein
MDVDSIVHYLSLTLEVFYLDLLLSGDNALVIALACRSLPPEQTRRAMLIGIEGAVVLRILLTTVAGLLLYIPLLKLIGGVALTGIAIKVTIEDVGERRSARGAPRNPAGMWSAVGTIVVADLVMSVDNVVALASVAKGSIFVLATGLLMSVPLLMYGSLFVTALLRRYPLLKRGGGAMLGWLAGDIAISDPLFSDWVNQQAPALTLVVPILTLVFVLVESRIMEQAQAAAHALRPQRRRAAARADAPAAGIEPAPAAAMEQAAAAVSVIAQRAAVAPALSPPPAPASAGHAATPRKKRFKRSFWIAAILTLALLWMLFKLLTLDFDSSIPALQFTAPTTHS